MSSFIEIIWPMLGEISFEMVREKWFMCVCMQGVRKLFDNRE